MFEKKLSKILQIYCKIIRHCLLQIMFQSVDIQLSYHETRFFRTRCVYSFNLLRYRVAVLMLPNVLVFVIYRIRRHDAECLRQLRILIGEYI